MGEKEMNSVKIRKGIYKIDTINTIKHDKPDDLFICASSFEERCRKAPSRLPLSGYKTSNAIMFNYYGGRKQVLRLFNRTKILDYLSLVTMNKRVIQINCDRVEPLDGMEKFEDLIYEMNIKLKDMAITVDISTFTKQYLLVLLRKIESLLKPKYVRVLYTEPGVYGRGDFKRLSFGVKNVVVVPEFVGKEVEGKKLLLVVFLGYEVHRTLAVIEKYEPDLLIAVVGRPPYYEGWDEFSIKTHQYLLSKPDVLKYEMPAREPNIVRDKLIRILNDFHKDFPNMYISPTGTKLQTVGIYEFVRRYQTARIVYAIPKDYLESYYTMGSGETWEYYLTSPMSIVEDKNED